MGKRRRSIESPIGTLVLIADDEGITRILFPHERSAVVATAADGPDDPILNDAERQLGEYFATERTEFELPLHMIGNRFDIDAWNAMKTIPYGETISYGEQAERAGHPGAFQAVGASNARNPIPIVVPCHRVIGSDGSLVGFGGGLDLKRRLLDLEAGIQRLPF